MQLPLVSRNDMIAFHFSVAFSLIVQSTGCFLKVFDLVLPIDTNTRGVNIYYLGGAQGIK